MRSPNYYAAPGFERAGLRRREPEWIRARVLDPTSGFVPVWRHQNLVIEAEGGEPRAAVLTVDAVGPLYGSLSDGDVEERLARGEFAFFCLLGDRALLGRNKNFPVAGMYSTLAGFVEPGESLEDAVAREVREETAIEVGAVHYHSSQPWPFPANIMLGFYAEAVSTAITVDYGELADANWFERDWLLSHVDDDSFRMPRRDSIARRLIGDW